MIPAPHTESESIATPWDPGRNHRSLRFLLGVASFQLVLATAHYLTVLMDLIGGFIASGHDVIGADEYFQNASHPVFIAQIFFYYTNVRGILAAVCIVTERSQYSIGDALMVRLQ